MAVLKGKGSMTGVNLIAKVYDNSVTKNGKSHYADVQIDARDLRGPSQTNLHLKAERVQGEDGKIRFNNGAPYSVDQMADIVKAAGPNVEPINDKDGNRIGSVYGVKGNVMPASRGTGLVVNTKSLEQSDFKVDPQTLDRQFESMRAAKAALVERQTETETAPAKEDEQVAEVEVAEPAFG